VTESGKTNDASERYSGKTNDAREWTDRWRQKDRQFLKMQPHTWY